MIVKHAILIEIAGAQSEAMRTRHAAARRAAKQPALTERQRTLCRDLKIDTATFAKLRLAILPERELRR